MKKIVLLLLALGCGLAARAACPERIAAFYSAYMRNMLHGDDARNRALCETRMSRALIEKLRRIASSTGADAVIRAQDVTEESIETLCVRELGNDWYMVGYCWRKGDETTKTEIPLKARATDDGCRIVYITPVWNGTRYGDDLLSDIGNTPLRIRRDPGEAFLDAFYRDYLSRYVSMPERLPELLDSLRARHLSPRAIRAFEAAASDYRSDGVEGYDLLIDSFDFDRLWYDSFDIRPQDGRYRVEYRTGNRIQVILVELQACGDGYLIDGIATDER